MKKILIAGKDSYVGTSFEKWVSQWPEKYQVDTVDMIGNSWEKRDFSMYNVVFLVAGIVHKKETAEMKELYEKVNHQLAVKVFKKCIHDKVKQFIFMSTGAVFTQSKRKNSNIVIDENSECHPETEYGRSKFLAEQDMLKAKTEEDIETKLAIIRPPMIYGKSAKGNYVELAKIAKKISIFPCFVNHRSMIYIINFCEFLRLCIEFEDEGFFYPQNFEYVNTTELVNEIAATHNKKIKKIKNLNWMIKTLMKISNITNKIFGNFVYSKDISSHYQWKYNLIDFKESIYLTENKKDFIDRTA